MNPKIKTFLIVGGIVVVFVFLVYGIFRASSQSFKLPDKFTAARDEARRISQEIVDLTNQTNQLIKDANISDFNGKSEEAVDFINKARQLNEQAYNKAFELSLAVQKMAEALSEIKQREFQQIAYEAVSLELALISDFITYTQHLNQFFNLLTTAVLTNKKQDRQAAAAALAEVNEKIKNINNLNQEFINKMSELSSFSK
jgi:hypothetical protein